MWKLEKPLLDDAIKDIDQIIANSGKAITEYDKPKIIHIYRMYDKQSGTIDENTNNLCSIAVRHKMEDMYEQKTYDGGRLYYIREQLFKLANICPMCGIGEPSQLDHQMPKSIFDSLSLCRLNLVPICSVCNNKKGVKQYSEFIHPYYVEFPQNVIFLVANVHINEHTHKLSWHYTIEPKGLSIALANKVRTQEKAIKLIQRLQKASINFVSDIFGCHDFTTNNALKGFLKSQLNYYTYRYGPNDWRTSLLRAFSDSPKFKVEEAKWLKSKSIPINKGVNV